MTTAEINQAIIQGTKKFGNRNAYLASNEYRKLHKQFSSTPKEAKKVDIVEVSHLGKGFFIRVGKNTYEAQLGDGIGAGSGPVSFTTIEAAKNYCAKRKYSF